MNNFFNKSLRILLTTNGLILFAGAMLGPIYAIFVQEIGGDIMDAGIAGALFALAAGVTSLFSGAIVDKSNNQKMIVIIGYLLISAGFLSFLWVKSVIALFIAQIVIGLGEAIYSPAFDLAYTKHLDKGKVGKEWGAWESLNYFTFAGGAAFGGWLAFSWGFTPLFILMSAISLFSAIYLYLTPKKYL